MSDDADDRKPPPDQENVDEFNQVFPGSPEHLSDISQRLQEDS